MEKGLEKKMPKIATYLIEVRIPMEIGYDFKAKMGIEEAREFFNTRGILILSSRRSKLSFNDNKKCETLSELAGRSGAKYCVIDSQEKEKLVKITYAFESSQDFERFSKKFNEIFC